MSTSNPIIEQAKKLQLSETEFYCPLCQLHRQADLFEGPGAVLLPFGDAKKATFFRCLKCKGSGTAATIRRKLEEHVPGISNVGTDKTYNRDRIFEVA